LGSSFIAEAAAGPAGSLPLRDVQEAASHADPPTTMRYDRARTSLNRHATRDLQSARDPICAARVDLRATLPEMLI
jgi:hypothetical protein